MPSNRDVRRARGRAVTLALLLLVTAACGAPDQSTPPVGASASGAITSPSALPSEQGPTDAPTPTVTPTPAPPTSNDATFSVLPAAAPPGHTSTISCSGDIGPSDPVAVVELRGDGPTVMRDYSDAANPRTVCEFGDERVDQLIDAHHVVISHCEGPPGCVLAVVDLPEVRYHWFALPRREDMFSEFIAVSPGLDEVSWSSTEGGDVGGGGDYRDQDRKLHVTRADGDHVVVARLRPVGGRCGTGDDSKNGAYSRSGQYMYALDVPMPSDTVFAGIHGLDRVFLFRPPRNGWPDYEQPAQPVWSPTDDVLYYRRAGSVWKWTPAGGEALFLPDTFWQFPTISPDGRYLAYAVPKEESTNHNVFLIDLERGGAPELLGENRNLPAFLTSTQLWLRSETGSGCVSMQTHPFIYDINEDAESRSIIEYVHEVWPATSAIY